MLAHGRLLIGRLYRHRSSFIIMRTALLAATIAATAAHNSMMIPVPRNSMDGAIYRAAQCDRATVVLLSCLSLSSFGFPPSARFAHFPPGRLCSLSCSLFLPHLGALPDFAGGGMGNVTGALTCTCADSRDCPMGDARKVGGAGQPCLWWSQCVAPPLPRAQSAAETDWPSSACRACRAGAARSAARTA